MYSGGTNRTGTGPIFDSLEPRLLLDGTIGSATATALSNGVSGLAAWAASLGDHEEFSQPLPLVIQSAGEVLGMQDVIDTRLAQPVAAYFAGDTTPTVQELMTTLEDPAQVSDAIT